MAALRGLILPESQRRTLEELTAELDLREGDARAKRSAFWTMLTLSGVIATAGVLADSTATVIGAMIIAPLSTPIMGIALSIAKRRRNGAMLFVFAGSVLVIVIGGLFAAFIPGSYDLAGNSQISGRTSPGLLDLVAAMATGLAGAVALARRDVGAVLPGVAIAISLVPPLAVVGVCLGAGSAWLALGALWLFLSNLLALVLAGTVVFTVLGYAVDPDAGPEQTRDVRTRRRAHRRAYVTLSVLFVMVGTPLALHSLVAYYLAAWTTRVETVAADWIEAVPEARVLDVELRAHGVRIRVLTPGDLPPLTTLLQDLETEVPSGLPILVETTLGNRIDGIVGEEGAWPVGQDR